MPRTTPTLTGPLTIIRGGAAPPAASRPRTALMAKLAFHRRIRATHVRATMWARRRLSHGLYKARTDEGKPYEQSARRIIDLKAAELRREHAVAYCDDIHADMLALVDDLWGPPDVETAVPEPRAA